MCLLGCRAAGATKEGWIVIRVFPHIENAKLMNLYHKGVEGQVVSRTVNWEYPLGLDRQEQQALGHVLTPVYLGEQTAMVGASWVDPAVLCRPSNRSAIISRHVLLDEARLSKP